MSWRQKLRTLFAFGRPDTSAEADAAVEAAIRSHAQAVEDRCRATATRAEADAWARQVRDHNTANRYDAWLREVMRGEAR
jgi:hypothetical protein